MARKPRYDKGVSVFVDRHGKARARFRLKGVSCYIPHPSSPDYKVAYKNLMQGILPRASRTKPRSIGDLCERFYVSAKFKRGGERWQATTKQVLEPFRDEAKDLPVAGFTFEHIERAVARRAKSRIVNGREVGGGFAAVRFHEQLVRLFDYAVKLDWIQTNPARLADKPDWEAVGFHSWTDEEIAQFQAHWPLGTKPRLALEIALWTGLRRGDIAGLGSKHVKGGRVRVKANKTGKDVDMRLFDELREAIEAMPHVGETFIETEFGKPFSTAGLGNWFRERCNEAGLPHCSLHGLRKALARRMAEGGATQPQLKAVGGWSGDSEVATYIAKADAKRLADEGIQKANKGRTMSNPTEQVRQKGVNLSEQNA